MTKETYFGYIESVQDALLVIEAARRGSLPRSQHRLTDKERRAIRSGSVFVWDESESGMRRWTDGRAWSPSRVSGCFLNYRELEHRRRGQGVMLPYSLWTTQGYVPTVTWVDVNTESQDGSQPNSPAESSPSRPPHFGHQRHLSDPCASGSIGSAAGRSKSSFRYKMDGMVKRTISVTVSENRKLHLISYFRKRDVAEGRLRCPRDDPSLAALVIPSELYPDVIMAPSANDDEDIITRSSASPSTPLRPHPLSRSASEAGVSFGSPSPPPPSNDYVMQEAPSRQPTASHTPPTFANLPPPNGMPLSRMVSNSSTPSIKCESNDDPMMHHRPMMIPPPGTNVVDSTRPVATTGSPPSVFNNNSNNMGFVPTPSASPDLAMRMNKVPRLTEPPRSASYSPPRMPTSNLPGSLTPKSSPSMGPFSMSPAPLPPLSRLAATASPSLLVRSYSHTNGVGPTSPLVGPRPVRCQEDHRQLDAFRTHMAL